jgi:hypothetical protein
MKRSVQNFQEHDGYLAYAFVALEALQELQPRHLWQIEIEQNQNRLRGFRFAYRPVPNK